MRLNGQQLGWLKDALRLQYDTLLEGANDGQDWDSNPGAREKRQEEFKAYVEFEGKLGNLLWHTEGSSNKEVLVLSKETYTALKKELVENIALTEQSMWEYANGDPENGPRSPGKGMIDDFKMLQTILKELE